MSQLPPDLAWRTWDHRYPGCFVHVPSRFALKISMYSGKNNHFETFDCEHADTYTLGQHTPDSGYVQLTLRSSDTVLGVEFAKASTSGIAARVRVVKPGEMMFRLVLIVEAGFLPPEQPGLEPGPSGRVELESFAGDEQFRTPSTAYAQWRSQHFAMTVSPNPSAASTYKGFGDVAAELEERGWLYRPQVQGDSSCAVFRFQGDPKAELMIAVAQHTDRSRAHAAAYEALASVDETIDAAAAAASRGDEPTRAIRDVMAWNTVWDAANDRPYTCLARTWVRHLGGWGIWLSDVLYNALLCARAGDPYMARENLRAVFVGQQPAGNLPCLLAGYEEWVDRTQLPVAVFVTWRVFLLTDDRTLLQESYPTLLRHYHWLLANRDGNKNGLFEYGSTPTGRAHNTHTKQGAMNESGMDNMPIFDDATFDADANTLELEEPGHNSLLALEMELLGRMAAELGSADDALMLQNAADALRHKIRTELWDPQREIFAGRFWSGEFAQQLSPTSFFPLVAGAASNDQRRALIERHLLNENEFWGSLPLPSTPFDDPVSQENSYWRGRIWPPLNFFVWEGLRRNGEHQLAAELAARSWEMFQAEWERDRHCHENFHISDADLHDSPDSDPFYSWGALIPLMAACECADVSPWDGLSLNVATTNTVELNLPGRRWHAQLKDDELQVAANGTLLFAVTGDTKVRRVAADKRHIVLRTMGQRVRVPGAIALARIDGEPVEVLQDGANAVVDLPGGESTVEVWLEEDAGA